MQISQPVAEKGPGCEAKCTQAALPVWIEAQHIEALHCGSPELSLWSQIPWVRILPLPLWRVKDGHKYFDTLFMQR